MRRATPTHEHHDLRQRTARRLSRHAYRSRQQGVLPRLVAAPPSPEPLRRLRALASSSSTYVPSVGPGTSSQPKSVVRGGSTCSPSSTRDHPPPTLTTGSLTQWRPSSYPSRRACALPPP